jgi:hypothetical protein
MEARMAVHEFTDARGMIWRAWDITPESIHPQTRAEDYLVDCFQIGWLVFETVSGDEKRRLCPYPKNWSASSQEQLRKLLDRADVVPPLKLQATRVATSPRQAASLPLADVAHEADRPDVTDLNVVRTFRYPGGRFWTVCVIAHPEDGGLPRLRFQAGARSIDLKSWPKEWPDYPDERLVEMLRAAAPRRAGPTADPTIPRRRWNDEPVPPRP